jgi:soluble lytic murein transglycosylase
MLSRYREPVRIWTDPIGHALFRLRLRPNHLTVAGLGVSLLAAAAFVAGRTRTAGLLLILAGLFDFFDGSLARASGQVTPFGAFLDSVIDRYSDLVVLLAIVVLFARMPHTRGAIIAMAGLVGSVMVSYTKARAESIGIECNVGVMERPERMICLIGGALFGLLEPALWILAVLANLTAIQRIAFTRRTIRDSARLSIGVALLSGMLVAAPAVAADTPPADSARSIPPATESAWAAAVAEFQAGDPAPLIRAFGSEAALSSPIADYARYLLTDALARAGDLEAARAVALGLAERHPNSRLAAPALLAAATLASHAGADDEAQVILKRLISSYPDAAEGAEALYLLGMIGEAGDQREAAVGVYQELRVRAPTTGWEDGATDRLAALAAAGVRVPELSIDQRLQRAERLLSGGVPKTAGEEAERIAKETRDSGIAVRALRIVADASLKIGRYEAAARALELAAGRAPADRRPGLLLDQARLWRRANQRERALTVLAGVEARGVDAEVAEALYLKGRTLEELDRQSQAASAYKAVAARYPARAVACEALWRLGWLEYLRGDARSAEQTWLRLIELPGGRAWRPPALYWAGRAKEQTAGSEAAATLYRRVLGEAPRSYYGLLAARRVTATAEAAPDPAIRLPADPREAIGDDPGFARADLLRRLGLVEFALQELEDVVARAVGDPVRLYGLSGVYIQEERYHLALRVLRRNFVAVAESGHSALPRAFWEMFYPFGWRQEITEASQRAGLDPYFVAALVRQESSYDPRALSPAGARGLMQLMPRTAQMVAGHRGLPFREGLLDDPGANIQIGAAFLAEQLREWSDPRLALAAYNAGPPRMRQWWQARRTNDIEAFVEQIPFDETRHYVKRVMFYWEEYRRIYGGS